MEASKKYRIGDAEFLAVAVRADSQWGHGLEVAIFDKHGSPWSVATFCCHPEFLDYDPCQAMDTTQLLKAAVELLRSGGHESVQFVKPSGLKLTLRLNGVDEGMASTFPRK
jgi:hypothetical protein